MKKLFNIKKLMLLFILFAAITARGQDIGINIISQENGVNDGVWAQDAAPGTTTVLVSICNNDGGSTALAQYKIRPLISFPNALVTVDASQPDLPAGWTVLSNDGTNIRLSNGTDMIPAAECRDFPIHVTPIAQGGPLTVTSSLSFANGIAPGSTPGPQTVGNLVGNDNSTTSIIVTAPLPIKLLSFEGIAQGCNAVLSWKTADEINFSHFDIEYSADGSNYTKIGSIAGKQVSTGSEYKFIYGAPAGTGFYRLKQADTDGSYNYSSTIIVKTKCDNRPVVIYPNPARDEVTINGLQSGELIQFYTINGQLLFQKKAVNAVEKVTISTFPAGTYSIVIIKDKVRVMSTQLIKQE